MYFGIGTQGQKSMFGYQTSNILTDPQLLTMLDCVISYNVVGLETNLKKYNRKNAAQSTLKFINAMDAVVVLMNENTRLNALLAQYHNKYDTTLEIKQNINPNMNAAKLIYIFTYGYPMDDEGNPTDNFDIEKLNEILASLNS